MVVYPTLLQQTVLNSEKKQFARSIHGLICGAPFKTNADSRKVKIRKVDLHIPGESTCFKINIYLLEVFMV